MVKLFIMMEQNMFCGYIQDRKKIKRFRNSDVPHQISIDNLSFSYRHKKDSYPIPISLETNLENIEIPFWNILITAFKEIDNVIQHPRS